MYLLCVNSVQFYHVCIHVTHHSRIQNISMTIGSLILPFIPSHILPHPNPWKPIMCSPFLFFFFIYLLIMLLQLSHFRPFTQLHPAHPLPPTFPPYSSCAWVILISSLAFTFPILFLPSPCLFSPYHLCYLFYVPFPLPLPPNPLLITLHVISISVVLFLF